MVGNGVCNRECFTAECQYDKTDCGCAPGCSTDMYGKCEYACLVPVCNYDGCWGQLTHIISYAWQATERTLDAVYNFDRDCKSIAPNCSYGNLLYILINKLCYDSCEPCLGVYGVCNNKGLAAGCLWGFDRTYGQCILCTNKQIYTSCVDHCTRANPDHPVSSKVCYPARDTSTPATPDAVYVTATAAGTNAGTAANPYFSLSTAFAQSYMAYTDIWLLAGEHSLTQARKPQPEAMLLASDAHPLRNGFTNQRVRVSTLLCTGAGDHPQCATERVTLLVQDLQLTLDVDCEVTFEKVIFNGRKLMTLGNVNPYGFYCPVVTEGSDGVLRNDQGQPVDGTGYVPQSECEKYNDAVFLSVSRTGALVLREVDFINLRHQPKAVIDNAGGTVSLSQVAFRNIVVSRKDGAVVRHVSSGSFSYVHGSVSYINNGYEVVDSLYVGGFLYADGLGDIGISSVSFSKNIAVAKSDSTIKGLFTLRQFRTFTFTTCDFRTSITTYLLHIDAEGLALSEWLDASGTALDFAIEHVYIKDCTFATNFALTALISATYSSDLQNLRIENCDFTENIVKSSAVVELAFLGTLTTEVIDGETRTGDFGLGHFPPRHTQVAGTTFSRNLGKLLFAVTNMANVAFSGDCSFAANGASESLNYNDLVFEQYISDPFAYLSSRHKEEDPAISPCQHLLHFNQCVRVTVTEALFDSNYCDAGIAGITATLIRSGLTVNSVTFQDNNAVSLDGSILSVTDISSPVTLSTAKISQNRNLQGAGIVYFGSGVYAAVQDCEFSGNEAPAASGILALDAARVVVSGSRFADNTATYGSGGALSFKVNDGAAQYSLEVRACSFTANRSAQASGGSVFVYSDKSTRPFLLVVADSVFTGNSASTLGAAVYVGSNLALASGSRTANCQFIENLSTRGTIALLFASGQFLITAGVFTKNQAPEGAGVAATIQTAAKVVVTDSKFEANVSLGGVIAILNIDSVKSFETQRCAFATNTGLAVSLQRTRWTDTASTFLSTLGSAALLADQSSASLTSAEFSRNASPGSGAAVLLTGASTLQCGGCRFKYNSAGDKGGAVYLEQSSVIALSDCAFQGNTCGDKGSAVFLLGSMNRDSVIVGSSFTANSADNSGVVSLLLSALRVETSVFSANTSKGASPGIVLNLSTLTIKQSKFTSQKGQIGSFLYVTTESVAVCSGSVFSSAFAESGGAFAVIGSNFTLTSSTVTAIAATSGAGLIAFSDSTIVLADVTMTSLSAADSALALLSQGSLSVSGCVFSGFSFGGIRADKLTSAVLTGSSFTAGRGSLGGAFTCLRCQAVEVTGCTFSNSTATYGGGLYLQAEALVAGVYRVASTTFDNNTAWRGGGAYTNNVNVAFQRCTFSRNKAERPKDADLWSAGDWGRGGGAISDCGQASTCAISFEFCRFIGNSAEVSGGGVAWQDVRPTVKNCSYDGNRADYANDLSSFAVALRMRDRRLSTISGVASGQLSTKPITVELIDHYGQVVTTDSSSVATLAAVDPVSTVLYGETKVTASRGVYVFDKYVVAAEPKTTAAITVHTSAVDLSKAEKAMDDVMYEDQLAVTMEMRPCELGESHVLTTCKVCEAGKYSLDPESLSCTNCPPEAICYGNYTMVPKAGYWRARYDSAVFYQCFYAPACTGSPEPPENLSLTGNCAVGYEGRLCQSCSSGFSHSNKNECARCPAPATNIVRLVFVGVGITMLAVLMVYTTMRSAYRQKSQASIYIKILMNYIQIMALVASFNLEWVQEVQSLLNAQDSAGSLTEQLFSLDCYLGSSHTGESSVYSTLLMIAVLPACVGLVSLAVWVMVYWSRRGRTFPFNGLVATVVILLFLVHPTITKFMFNIFACMSVDGEYYLLQELSVPCWDSKHSFYCVACALPSIVLWVMGVPALCLLYLVRSRRSLGALSARLRLGFLFNGFRAHAYYWEFVILYRKILLISCSVFLTTVSIPLQALCVVVILLAALYLQDQVQPYTTHTLNDIELRSVLCATVTIYCGLFFLTGATSSGAGIVLFSAIVVANAVFLWHWLRSALSSYLMIIVNSIPCLRVRFGHFGKVKDCLDDDLLIRPHVVSAFGAHHCKGFSPTIEPAAKHLRTMKDVYLMKLRYFNENWKDRVETPLPQDFAQVTNPFLQLLERTKMNDSGNLQIEDIK